MQMEDPVISPDFMLFDRLTYHVASEGNPDSVNVTVNNTFENDTDSDRGTPFTWNDPPSAWYILLFVAMLYEYDPFVRENEYEDPVIAPDFIPLLRLTYHADPVGNPDSVNVTVYVCNLNDILTCLFAPFTDKDPYRFS